MARLFIPPQLREEAQGAEFIEGGFVTVQAAVDELRRQYPRVAKRLVQPDGRAAVGWAIVVDGVAAPLGPRAPLTRDSEIHILPALGGG